MLLDGSTVLLEGGNELLGRLEVVAELLGSDALTLDDERLSLDVDGVDELDGELLLDSLEELLEELLEEEQQSQQQQPAWWLSVHGPSVLVSAQFSIAIVMSRLYTYSFPSSQRTSVS